MHTFLEQSDGTCAIGHWQICPEGYAQFTALFMVEDIEQAIAVCNVLNGGDSSRGYYRIIRQPAS